MSLFWQRCKKIFWWYLNGLAIFGGYLILEAIYTDNNSTVFLTAAELITRHGYPAEVHTILTSDGFILEHHRIPYGRYSNNSVGPPVILQHGFLCASDAWVMNSADKDLAFILADAGFDVWLPNVRGSPFSYVHQQYGNKTKFNDFSFHEIGMIDVAETIDYILATTGHNNLSFVGHSMGTTILSILLSTKPNYNAKVNYFVAIAPVWKRAPFNEFGHLALEGVWFYMGPYYELLDLMNVFQRHTLRQYFSYYLLGNKLIGDVCKFFFKHVAGTDSTRPYSVPVSALTARFPTGLTYNILKHYHELLDYDEFRMRDYGLNGNLLKYNRTEPPTYDTRQIKVPTSIYHSEQDTLADPKSVEYVVSQVPNLDKVISIPGFNHFDLLWSDDAARYLFYNILETLERVNNESFKQCSGHP